MTSVLLTMVWFSRRRAAAVARVLRPRLDKADYPFRVSGRGQARPCGAQHL